MTTSRAEIYGGKYVVELNHGNHRYKVYRRNAETGAVTPIDAHPDGVSTIAKAVAPFQGDDWGAKCAAHYIRDACRKCLEEAGMMPELSLFLGICEEAETAHQVIRDKAGDRGSEAHDIIEKILTGQPVDLPDNPIVLASLKAFDIWRDSNVCEVMEAERLIYHDELFYCGKTDIYGLYNSAAAIVDFKTGSGFYTDQPYQLTGYAVALEKEHPGLRIDDGYIVHLDKHTKKPVTYHVKIDDGMRQAWLNAVLHYKDLKKVRKMVKEMTDGLWRKSA